MRRLLKMIRELVSSLIDAIVAALTGGTGSTPPVERVTNGAFDNGGTGWAILSSAWTISGGTASSKGTGGFEQNVGLVNSGLLVAISIETATSHTLQPFSVRLYRSGALVQTVNILLNAAGTYAPPPFPCDADWDTVRFVAVDSTVVTLNSVSVIA
jgi:hypothetical protein